MYSQRPTACALPMPVRTLYPPACIPTAPPPIQVLISYGQKSNAELLLLYGFVVDRNLFDEVREPSSLPSRAITAFIAALKGHHCLHCPHAPVPHAAIPSWRAAVAWLRLAAWALFRPRTSLWLASIGCLIAACGLG